MDNTNKRMKNNQQPQQIDLVELCRELLHKAWIIVLCGIVGAVAAMGYATYMVKPVYQSDYLLYVLSKTTSVTSIVDFQLGNVLTADFQTIAKSKPVLDAAIEELKSTTGKEFTRGQLADSVMITNEENTRLLRITVRCGDPEDACAIANAIGDATASQMAEITRTDPPTTVERAEVNYAPVSAGMRSYVIKGVLLMMVLSAGIITVLYLMNDKIRTEEDIERYLDSPVLAVLPLRKGRKVPKEDD